MALVEPRTAVLLGAGASADAGLPLTYELAEQLVRSANSAEDLRYGGQDWVRALNFVYGAMVGYQAEDGSDPLQAVNIERLISALRLLQEAKDHEVAPFVSAWKPGALGMGTRSLPSSLGRPLARAIGKSLSTLPGFAENDIVEGVAAISRAASGAGNPEAFSQAESHILDGLADMLGRLRSVDYLRPLVDLADEQPGGLDVLSLNYDLAVEKMAQEAGASLDRGIQRWEPGKPLSWKPVDKQINLYKLHGSLDWFRSRISDEMSAPLVLVDAPGSGESGTGRLRTPWIVVGEREKLATDGPTLALLRAAEDALGRSSHLVVVGYSFGDRHINAIIRNWMLGDDERTIGIVNREWNPTTLDGFTKALLNAYGAKVREGRKSRIVPVIGTAAQRLSEALWIKPSETPSPYVVARAESIGSERTSIHLRLLGPDLFRVVMDVVENSGDGGQVGRTKFMTVHSESELDSNRPAATWGRSLAIDRWRADEEVVIYSNVPNATSATVTIRGRRVDGAENDSFRSPLDWT